jgi:hypothetical protein
VIYFIRAVNSGTIKIGVSNDPRRRLESMQTGSPEPLELLGVLPGGVDEERRLHRRFSAFRIHGEWFRGDETLAKAIDELVKKPIDELLDEKSAEVWLIAGELLCEHDDDWEPITLFCVRRSDAGRLFPDPAAAIEAARPGCRFRAIKSIADLSASTKYWPVAEHDVRRALASDDWEPVVFDCDDHQPCPSRHRLSRPPEPIDLRPELVVGVRVSHPMYGTGRIDAVCGAGSERKGRVAFDRGGPRTFVLAHCPLQLAPYPAQFVSGPSGKLPDWALADIERDKKAITPETN